MVRRGILTPFHKLKGFERRVQERGPPIRQDVPEEDSTENLASTSIARAAQSISQIALARPTTKLLDAEALPALEPPTRPFQRLRGPLKRARSSRKKELDKNERNIKRTRRPGPEKRWRKDDLINESLDGSGMISGLYYFWILLILLILLFQESSCNILIVIYGFVGRKKCDFVVW